jgi:SAM-dependent methyltransferase
VRFDAQAVRDAWDHAAAAYAEGQATGRDRYRYAFFGPEHIALCGDVTGQRVLDVGCGAGYLGRELAERGATVGGVDISQKMIDHARQHESGTRLDIAFVVGDAAALPRPFDPGWFDLAVSCVALQDMPDPERVMRGVRESLRPGGRFVFSITHPCTNTPFRRWERDAAGKRWLCVDRYFERGPVEYPWTGWAYDFTTQALHAPLEDWFAWSLAAGFTLRGFHEPQPSTYALRQHPDLEDATRVPYFAIFDLVRTDRPIIDTTP